MTKVFAYACKAPEIMDGENKMVFLNSKHGMCEFYNLKINKKKWKLNIKSY